MTAKRYSVVVYEGDAYRAAWYEAEESPAGSWCRAEDYDALKALASAYVKFRPSEGSQARHAAWHDLATFLTTQE